MRESAEKVATSGELRERVAAAWFAKIDLRFDDAVAILTQVKLELGIPTGHLEENQVARFIQQGQEIECDVLSLSAELSRCICDEQYAHDLLKWIESAAKREKRTLSFWFFYARGMGCFASGDFTLAFEEYLRARERVTGPTERLIAEGNLLLTLENLGLPYSDTLRQVEQDLKDISEQSLVGRTDSQLYALRLREFFRDGDFKKLFETEEKRISPPVDQGYYFCLWVSQLPYHFLHRELKEQELARFSLGPSYQHHKAYRQRTLQGMIHPDEKKLTKPSEFVERFYLWVWRWLKNPEESSVEKILLLLREFTPPQFSHRLTAEDHELFGNGLLWLSLFDPMSEPQLRKLLGRLNPSLRVHYPLLKLESLVVHYLIALREAKNDLAEQYLAALKNNPLWTSDQIEFRKVVEFANGHSKTEPKFLAPLAKVLADTFRRSHSSRVSVNLSSGEIKANGKENIVSTAIASAFYLLHDHSRVSCERFCRACFQFSRFDPIIHVPKIQNLLSRMKTMVGEQIRFGLKNGHVFAEGDWGGVEFKKVLPISGLDQDLEDLSVKLFEEAPLEPSKAGSDKEEGTRRTGSIWSELPWSEGVTRAQVEDWLERPRSSVNRILKQWLDEGKILREGSARSSRYLLRGEAHDKH